MDVLLALATAAPEPMTREALLERVWPDMTVVDNVVHRAVARLRRALGDEATKPKFIETIPRRGYRLVTMPEPQGAGMSGGARERRKRLTSTGRDSADRSVWVRSFRAAGGGPGVQNLSDLLKEEISGTLSEYPEIRTVVQISARSLPAYALDGRLQVSAGELRLRATLLRLRDGSTVWSETFDASEIQRPTCVARLTTTVTRKVRLKVAWDHQCERIRRRTSSAESAKLVRMAIAETLRKNQGDATDIELEQVNALKAMDLDPGLVDSYWLLADTYIVSGMSGLMPWREAAQRAERVLQQGLAIDASEPMLHCERGDVHSFFTLDYATARSHFETAIRLDPRSPYTRWFYSALARIGMMRGDLDTALEQLSRAVRVYDADGRVLAEYASALHFSGKHRQAVEAADAGLALMRGGPIHGFLAIRKVQALMALGDEEAARCAADQCREDLNWQFLPLLLATLGQEANARRELRDTDSRRLRSPELLASTYATLGLRDPAFTSIREAVDNRCGYALTYLRLDPVYDVLRGDPRWEELMRHVETEENKAANDILQG